MTKQVIWQGASEEVLKRLRPNMVDCVLTDPPFGVDNQSNMAVTSEGKNYARKIANDESPEVAIKVFRDVMDVLLPNTKDDCDMYIFTAHQVFKEWLILADEIGLKHGFVRKGILVWEKDGPGMGDLNSWGLGHELIIYLKKGKKERNMPRRNGVLHVPQVRPGDLIHPHEKPLALMELLMSHSTKPGDLVVDPFGGSGVVARAARNLDRSAICVEYDERNHAESVKALESMPESIFH